MWAKHMPRRADFLSTPAGLRHPEAAHVAVIATALVAVVVLVASSTGLTFFFDEWQFIRERDLSVESLLVPHNEHFSAVLVLIHRGLNRGRWYRVVRTLFLPSSGSATYWQRRPCSCCFGRTEPCGKQPQAR